MDDKRLLHEQQKSRTTAPRAAAKDWKAVRDREEELRSVATVFQHMGGVNPPEPTAAEWRSLSQEVASRIASSKTPLMPTLRDRLTSTDSDLLRWFWIIVALLVIAGVATAVAFSLEVPVIDSAKALTSAPPAYIERITYGPKARPIPAQGNAVG